MSFINCAIIVIFYCSLLLGIDANIYEDKTDFLLITVATNETDGFRRFISSTEKHNIPVKILGMKRVWEGGNMAGVGGGFKVNLLKEAMAEMEDYDNFIIMFTDSYDVIMLEGVEEIMKKFKEFNARIVFSAEPFCWPDTSLSSQYPVTESPYKYLNSGGFIGYFKDIYELIKNHPIGNTEDDQLYYTKLFLDSSLREKHRMRLDTQAYIFQNLYGSAEDVKLDLAEGGTLILKNVRFASKPSFLHGNGLSKVTFNSLSNYLVGNWHAEKGCIGCRPIKGSYQSLLEELSANHPVILMGIFISQKTPFMMEFFKKISQLNYPKNKIHLYIYNNIDYHSGLVGEFIKNFGSEYISMKQITPSDEIPEQEARSFAIDLCLKKKCGYFFAIDSVAHLDSPDIISALILNNKGVVGPMLVRPFKAWSNFWGSLNSDGYYARSFDYMQIVNNEKRGVWNVPYLTHCYLVNATLLPLLNEPYKDPQLDPDMAFCKHLRDKGIFMFVDNIEDMGHLVNNEKFLTQVKHPEFYELLDNQVDWEARYLHENYTVNFNESNKPLQPCPDVYWFPIVSPKFCSDLIDIMEGYGKWSDGSNKDERLTGGYENVPTRDIHMNQVGLEPLWMEFLRLFVRPLQEMVFTGYYHDPPKSLMNFVVRYRPGEQPSLRPHHDSSTYTINVALNRPKIDYEGGGCHFIRYNCSVTDTRLGWMLMHPGRLTHFHEGLKVTKGTRYIMISFVDP